MEPPTLVAVNVSADMNGPLVVCSNPTESVYRLAPNGLFLPKEVTPLPVGWASSSPYPEFAQALVAEWDQMQNAALSKKFTLPTITSKPALFATPNGKPAKQGLASLVPGIEERRDMKCPVCPLPCYTVSSLIVHLNDDHRWPREKIANYLDTLPIDLTIRKVA